MTTAELLRVALVLETEGRPRAVQKFLAYVYAIKYTVFDAYNSIVSCS